MAKKFPIHPPHPERLCWGCDLYCPATDMRCGNGAEARDAGDHLRGVPPAAQLVKHVVRRGADRNIAEIHHGDA